MSVHEQIPMKAAPVPAQPSLRAAPFGTLQRKCACGGTAGASGGCDDCNKKKRLLQRARATGFQPVPERATGFQPVPRHGQDGHGTRGGMAVPAMPEHERDAHATTEHGQDAHGTSSAHGRSGTTVPQIVHDVLGSAGQALDCSTRSRLEPRLGHDFSRVRVHTDARAAESARAVNAVAYTVGRDVVFGAGQYRPDTAAGIVLLGHELTHVVQQQGSPAGARGLRVGPAGDAYEREADQVARGLAAPSTTAAPVAQRAAPVSIQRSCGVTEIGTQTGCTLLGGDPSGERYLFNVNCDVFKLGEDDKLKKDAGKFANGDALRVHGLASEEGDATFNENLACARAQRAEEIINANLGPGVKVSISLFTHGGTPGDPDSHRSVVVEKLESPEPKPPSANKSVNVTITGGAELWFFNGLATPPGYPLEQTLTANAAGLAGTFTWSIRSGANFATFQSDTFKPGLSIAFGPTVILKSIAASGAVDDVLVTVSFAGSGATGTASRNFTVRTPQSLKPTGDTPTAVPRGYRTDIHYDILDQVSAKLPRTIEVNEQWDEKPPVVDFAGSNWPTVVLREGHFPVPAGAFFDIVKMSDSAPPTLKPTPTATLTPPGNVKVQHFRGHWQVGSPNIGGGKRVRTIIWHFFQDHGEHEFVSTP